MTQTQFQIVTSGSSLERSSLGSISGTLAVRLGDFVFPDENWSDFPVVVLGWWHDAARSRQAAREGRFPFMDGPFEFRASPPLDGVSGVVFEKQGAQGFRQLHSGLLDPDEIAAELARASREIVRECRSRGWADDDVSKLSQAIN
jgi:hypothetical protein